ncbi:MAG: glycosyltransferase family 4 protein [Nibricoccus sp.]
MNALLLAPELFASEGGIPRILRLYLKALCELAEPSGSVTVVALNDATFDSRDLRRYSNNRLVDWAACDRNKIAFVKAARRLSKTADLVVCGHVGQLPVAWGLRKLSRKKFKYTLVAHGIEVWRPFSRLESLALRGADRIWCVSEFTRREFLRHCKVPLSNTAVLHNALDPHLQLAQPAAPSTGFDILTISRLNNSDSYKGIDHLIEAMPAIRREIPAARLRVVGRGDDLPRLHQIAGRLHQSSAIDFLGYVNDDELKRELSACRVFALPSQKEGFGLVFLEAMIHGKPCVGARDGGIPEVLTPESGLLVGYGNIPELAKACVDALRRTWEPGAIQNRAAQFSYSRFRDKLTSLIPISA